ncbi:MAG TPA: hypothetical protein VG370_21905 [Chloroflexota bacterium]|jgi:ABC-type glycerol-3-phosphate transport system substrate-binding protein|nr:hypothetical protein [Chloroflexota bacterium]
MATASRRRFLGLVGAAGLGVLAAACAAPAAPTATPAPAPKPAEKPAEAPKPAEKPTEAAKPAEKPTEAPKPAAAAPSTGGAKVTVRWQFRGSDADLKAAQDYVTGTFGKDKPNIDLTIEPAPDGRDEKLIAAMVGGNAPDVFESWTDNVTLFADRGQVLDVEPNVKRDFKDTDIKDFYAWQWHDLVLPSGIRFGVPKYVNVMITWVNKDVFDKAGEKVPDGNAWTHDDYARIANKLTTKKGDQVDTWGLFYPVWSWDRFWYKLEAWGGEIVNPKDTTEAVFDQEKSLAAFEWSRKLIWDDKAMAQRLLLSPAGQGFNTQQLFASGKFAMVEDGFYPFSMARSVEKKTNWTYMHTPNGPSGKKRVLGTTDAFVQWKSSKVLDQGWEVMKFVSGPGYQENQVKSTGLLPIRFSVLDNWKKICIEKFPELEAANLDIGKQAMEMGYPGNRILFKKDAEARKIMVPALEKVFWAGGTPVTYFKDVAKEVTAKMKE